MPTPPVVKRVPRFVRTDDLVEPRPGAERPPSLGGGIGRASEHFLPTEGVLVQQGDVDVGGGRFDTLDFDGLDFLVTEAPTREANVKQRARMALIADWLIHNYALFTSSRADGNPGRRLAWTVTGPANQINIFEFPHNTTAVFPLYRFGISGTGAGRIIIRDVNAVFWTLAHATIPSGGLQIEPKLVIADFMLRESQVNISFFEATPSCWFGLAENEIADTALTPSDLSYGAVLGITVGSTGNYKAIYRKDGVAGSVLQTVDLGVAPDDKWHRWTFLLKVRRTDQTAGSVEIYYDRALKHTVTAADLPGAAMILQGAVGATASGTAINKFFELAHLQVLETRAEEVKPWV